jgi:energy-coupling factor transporter transmembrane protein EcfT
MTIALLGAPAVVTVLASKRGRRTFARRLLVTAPLLGVALLLRWFGHAATSDWLAPALRVASAVAWSSCLSTWLAPPALRAALRSLGAPLALVELIVQTRRFAIQLATTASEAWNAAALRAGLCSLRATTATVGHVAGVIVVRAFDRAECVAIASALRGRDLADHALLEQRCAAQSKGSVQ